MVALAVFSLAALALIRLEGATLRSTGVLERTLLANLVAQPVAARLRAAARHEAFERQRLEAPLAQLAAREAPARIRNAA